MKKTYRSWWKYVADKFIFYCNPAYWYRIRENDKTVQNNDDKESVYKARWRDAVARNDHMSILMDKIIDLHLPPQNIPLCPTCYVPTPCPTLEIAQDVYVEKIDT